MKLQAPVLISSSNSREGRVNQWKRLWKRTKAKRAIDSWPTSGADCAKPDATSPSATSRRDAEGDRTLTTTSAPHTNSFQMGDSHHISYHFIISSPCYHDLAIFIIIIDFQKYRISNFRSPAEVGQSCRGNINLQEARILSDKVPFWEYIWNKGPNFPFSFDLLAGRN